MMDLHYYPLDAQNCTVEIESCKLHDDMHALVVTRTFSDLCMTYVFYNTENQGRQYSIRSVNYLL